MILGIEAGNTSTSFALLDGGEVVHVFRCSTSPQRTVDEYFAWLHCLFESRSISWDDLEYCVLCSVVPAVLDNLKRFARDYFMDCYAVLDVNHPHLGMKALVDSPQEVGSDLLAVALACHAIFGEQPVIQVDCGTATTVSWIDEKGNFCGCAIAPGFKISLEALCGAGAQLPIVNFEKPTRMIGKNTADAISAGMYFGYLGMLEKLILSLRAEECSNRGLSADKVRVVVTGGYSTYFESPLFSLKDRDLLHKGLWVFYQRIQQAAQGKHTCS